MAVLLTLYVTSDSSRLAYDVQPAHINAVFMLVLFSALGLPSAVFGWTEKEL
jgi:hypothetical protein